MARFSEDELVRYSRQMLLREVGGRGQERLRAATPELTVVGDAGVIAARYLLRAGVLRLRVRAGGPLAAELAALLAEDVPPGVAPQVSDADTDPSRSELHVNDVVFAVTCPLPDDPERAVVARGCRCPTPVVPSQLAPYDPLALQAGSLLALCGLQALLGLPGVLPQDGQRLLIGQDLPIRGPCPCSEAPP